MPSWSWAGGAGTGDLEGALATLGRATEVLGEIRDLAGQAQVYIAVGELCEQRAELFAGEAGLRESGQTI